MHKLKTEKDHLLKKVQQLTDEKQFYKKKLEEHIGQNNTNYLKEEIIINPVTAQNNESTYDEKEASRPKHKYETVEKKSKKSKMMTSNSDESSKGKSSVETKSSESESKTESADITESSMNKSQVSSKRKTRITNLHIMLKKVFQQEGIN